jgi:methylmalonyl-CoA mutase cobalamin-binding subunit
LLAADGDIMIVVGGVVPPQDYAALERRPMLEKITKPK